MSLKQGADVGRDWVIGVAMGVACALPGKAQAEVDNLVKQALTLEAQGRMAQAYALLAPVVDARAGDPDFDYALGIAAADSGRPGDAIAAFQRVLAVWPDHAQARAEIARLYAQAGDVDTARAEFATVIQDPTLPDPVRQRVGGLIRDYDRAIRGGGNQLSGFIDADVGYDDNVNSATSLTSITLPVFAFLGPATLGGTASRMSGGFHQVQAGTSGSMAAGRQDRLFASVLGSWRDTWSSEAFDQAAVTATAGGAHTTATGDVVAVSGQAQRFWLGRRGFRTGIGVIGQYTARLRRDRAVSTQLQYFRFDYDGDPSRDAHRYAATLTYSDRTALLSIGGGREATIRDGARNLGYWFGAVQGGSEVPLARAVAIIAGAGIEHRDYDATDPLFLSGRRDTQIDATIGLRLTVRNGIAVRPRATVTRNFSNLSLYDYSRVTGSVGLTFAF